MKKKITTTLMLTIIATIIMGCSSTDDTSKESSSNSVEGEIEEEITLRVSSGLADIHSWYEVIFNPWMEKIEEDSNGMIKFDVHTGGSLVPIQGELDALNEGTIDIALPLWPIYEPSRFPLSEVTMLPLTKTDSTIAAEAYQNFLNSDVELADGKTFMDIDYNEHDIKALEMPPIQAYVLSSKKQKFDTIDSFKGSILRTSGPAHEILSENLGASSTSIPASDLFEAVNRGTVDGLFMGIADWPSYGFDEIMKYTLEGLNLGHFNAVIAMTDEKWEELPEEAQVIIQEATDTLQMPGGAIWDELGEKTKEFNIEQGGEFYHLDDLDSETKEFIVEAMEETWFDWIDNVEEKGYPGKEAAILWRDLIIESGGDVPDKVKELE